MHILNLQRRGMPSFLKRVTFVVSSPIIVGYDRSEFRAARRPGSSSARSAAARSIAAPSTLRSNTLSQTMPIRRLMTVSL